MKDAEFAELLNDFDGFMRRHGYYTTNDIAKYSGVSPDSVRMAISRGKIKGSVKINKRHYIPLESVKG